MLFTDIMYTKMCGLLLLAKSECELGNPHDPFVVAVMKDSQIIGHVPHTISCILFIRG